MNKKSRIEIEESVNLSNNNNNVVQIFGVNDSQLGYGISIKGGEVPL